MNIKAEATEFELDTTCDRCGHTNPKAQWFLHDFMNSGWPICEECDEHLSFEPVATAPAIHLSYPEAEVEIESIWFNLTCLNCGMVHKLGVDQEVGDDCCCGNMQFKED